MSPDVRGMHSEDPRRRPTRDALNEAVEALVQIELRVEEAEAIRSGG